MQRFEVELVPPLPDKTKRSVKVIESYLRELLEQKRMLTSDWLTDVLVSLNQLFDAYDAQRLGSSNDLPSTDLSTIFTLSERLLQAIEQKSIAYRLDDEPRETTELHTLVAKIQHHPIYRLHLEREVSRAQVESLQTQMLMLRTEMLTALSEHRDYLLTAASNVSERISLLVDWVEEMMDKQCLVVDGQKSSLIDTGREPTIIALVRLSEECKEFHELFHEEISIIDYISDYTRDSLGLSDPQSAELYIELYNLTSNLYIDVYKLKKILEDIAKTQGIMTISKSTIQDIVASLKERIARADKIIEILDSSSDPTEEN